ncbi:hypothetical protein K438DRAFT_1991164 [Mycena galopus ATCC 62051]|nr:hypothetical protein K438DRAFT_1991164 [Mycena galopus ATCC 62051]
MCCRANLTASLPTCLRLPSLPAPPALTTHPASHGLATLAHDLPPAHGRALLEGQDGMCVPKRMLKPSTLDPHAIDKVEERPQLCELVSLRACPVLASLPASPELADARSPRFSFPRMAARLPSAFISTLHPEAVPAQEYEGGGAFTRFHLLHAVVPLCVPDPVSPRPSRLTSLDHPALPFPRFLASSLYSLSSLVSYADTLSRHTGLLPRPRRATSRLSARQREAYEAVLGAWVAGVAGAKSASPSAGAAADAEEEGRRRSGKGESTDVDRNAEEEENLLLLVSHSLQKYKMTAFADRIAFPFQYE